MNNNELTPQPEIQKAYFANPTERQTADIDANKANLRAALDALQVCVTLADRTSTDDKELSL
jgi:hypothetical protein